MSTKIKDFWVKYEAKIILIIGFCLVSALSFEAGILMRNKGENQPLIIEKPIEQVAGATDQNAPEAQNLASDGQNRLANTSANTPNCAFIGSRNSDKYHLSTCSYAKRIKPENSVCFKDENEAKLKGYQPDKNCIK